MYYLWIHFKHVKLTFIFFKYPLQLLPIHTMRLGVELDSFDGHHYISTVAPDGPVANHGLLRPEDELLEVYNYLTDLA